MTYRIEIPSAPGSSLPNANQEGGVSKAEVALATRQFFQRKHPENLEEQVETFMRKRGWELIWTPPYMPQFQPIERFWAYGKRFVGMNFELKRTMRDVWQQLRKGLYGTPRRQAKRGAGSLPIVATWSDMPSTR